MLSARSGLAFKGVGAKHRERIRFSVGDIAAASKIQEQEIENDRPLNLNSHRNYVKRMPSSFTQGSKGKVIVRFGTKCGKIG